MPLISSKEFYRRHKIEIFKNLFSENKNLIISDKNSNFFIEKSHNLDFLNVDTNEDLNKILINNTKYDCIVLSDMFEVNDDILGLLKLLKKNLNNDGTILLTSITPIWDGVLSILEMLNLKNKSKKRSYIHLNKLSAVLDTINFQITGKRTRQYFPFKLFYFGNIINNFLEIILYFFNFGIRSYFTIKEIEDTAEKDVLSKTIIVPAKNEEGNLNELINRIPYLGNNVEVIISCGISNDNTLGMAKSLKSDNFIIKVIEQTSKGKANAVWEACEQSSNDLIAILDADLSVDPEELSSFFELIETKKCDFVNGTRLIYSMEKGSMRFINNFGNRLFQYVVSKIIRLPLTDSLCGTKVFKKNLYEKIKKWQSVVKIKDPFGDFDLLFAAAYSSQKIVEYPIHYRARKYGTTQIRRFKDGFKLIKYLSVSFYKFNSSR